jgi:hypothetical protein
MEKKYLYNRKKFCVPVTKAEPLEQIQFIIDAFIAKELTFCIDGEGESWEIWRIEEESDTDKIKKEGPPERPKYLYVKGVLVDDYDVV